MIIYFLYIIASFLVIYRIIIIIFIFILVTQVDVRYFKALYLWNRFAVFSTYMFVFLSLEDMLIDNYSLFIYFYYGSGHLGPTSNFSQFPILQGYPGTLTFRWFWPECIFSFACIDAFTHSAIKYKSSRKFFSASNK